MTGITITRTPFGVTKEGKAVTCWTLTNANGMKAEILDWGCVIRSLVVPDRTNTPIDVVLGYDDIASYEQGTCFFGAFVGRYANRLKNASFTLYDRTYQLERNDGNNHLHGSYCHTIFASSVEGNADTGDTLVFRHYSPDGEEGYPGALEVEVRYTLTADNAMQMVYDAKADADTILNLTNHSYFNLAGAGDILDHQLQLACDRFTEADAETLPTGQILSVAGTVLDFQQPRRIGEGLQPLDEQLTLFRGYDHNMIFGASPTGWAYCPRSGIRLDMTTTQPAVQLYTGNFVDDDAALHGKGGVRYPRYAGFCLETQHYPCSPSYPTFPSVVLHAGETYHHSTTYRFSVAEAQPNA